MTNQTAIKKTQTLYLCEKPSQGRDIAKLLSCTEKGSGFLQHKSNNTIVSWCFGHLLEAAKPDAYCENIKPWRMEVLPIIPVEWELEIKDKSKIQFKTIQALLKETRTVVIATDADREGEVIAREILEYCKFKGTIKRLWLSALDDVSIQKALCEIREGYTTENLYYAGLGRQRADWLIGMNMTMAASVIFGKYGEGVLSVGRVQTPTLKLIVDRDKAIEDFKPKNYFELIAQFTTQENEPKSFYAKWQAPEYECDEEGYLLNYALIQSFADKVRNKPACVFSFDDKQKNQHAPLCLSLSQLQKIASSKWGYSASKTLETAQSLYETHKAITYPRTDCGYLPESQHSQAKEIFDVLEYVNLDFAEVIMNCDINQKSMSWNDKKITAHHAIIPTTNKNVLLSKMSDAEQKIYDLICKYYLAQFLGDYEYVQRTITVLCEGEKFKASSNTSVSLGWKRVLNASVKENADKNMEEEETAFGSIPYLTENQILLHTDEKILTKHTKPPAHFTEGTLIEAMKSIGKLVDEKYKKILKETAGIGTEATRASIIETLFLRNYIQRKQKSLIATERGKNLISCLPSMVCDPILTAEWEQALDKVGEGQLNLDAFMKNQGELLNCMLNAISDEAKKNPETIRKLNAHQEKIPKQNANANGKHKCTVCDKPLSRRVSSKDKTYFWGCTGFPKCRFTAKDSGGLPIYTSA
jgi:DNA topoisomerase-3